MATTRPTPAEHDEIREMVARIQEIAAAMYRTSDSGALLDLSQQLRQAARQLREAVGKRRPARGAGGERDDD
jgi:hypothetical protein